MNSFLTAVFDLPDQNLIQKRVKHYILEVHCVEGERKHTQLFNAKNESLEDNNIKMADMT